MKVCVFGYGVVPWVNLLCEEVFVCLASSLVRMFGSSELAASHGAHLQAPKRCLWDYRASENMDCCQRLSIHQSSLGFVA